MVRLSACVVNAPVRMPVWVGAKPLRKGRGVSDTSGLTVARSTSGFGGRVARLGVPSPVICTRKAVACALERTRRPNVLLITTDQQRYDALGAAGNPLIRTPVLDGLCAEGTRFQNCYTPSPVCVPARHALLTGLLPHNNGCVNNGSRLAPGTPTMMGLLSAAGYVTHGVGKMHFSPPRRSLGFQALELSEEIPAHVEQDDYLPFLLARGFGHVHEPHGVRSDMYYVPQVSQLPAELHTTAWTADRAAAFLRGHDQHRPFFLWTSFIKPHPPFDPPVPWNKLYRTVDMPKPFRPEGYRQLQTWWMRHQNRYKYREDGPDDTLARTLRAAYYACVSFIDHHVGRILRVLAATGLAQETLVLFTSDHGELLGDYGSWGKRSFLDPSVRVPLIARWPGHLPAGGVVTTPVSLVDIMPTVLAAAGVDSAGCRQDGADLSTLPTAEPRLVCAQLAEDAHGTYMATDGRLKYFYSAPDDREFLFDLAGQEREERNLAADPAWAGRLQDLRERLAARLRGDGYERPFTGAGWRRYRLPPDPQDPDDDRIFQEARWTDPWPRIPGYTPERLK